MTGESDPIKKNIYEVCLTHRDRIISEGN